jgi:hypothetical protein
LQTALLFHDGKYKNNIFLALECLCCPENGGAGALHFLVEHFSFLGFEAQYWMLLVAIVIAGFVLLTLATRNRN